MRSLLHHGLLASLFLLGCGATPSPPLVGPDPTFLEQYARTYRFRLGAPSRIKVSPDGDAVLFLRSGPRDFEQDLWLFDPATGKERVLLTAKDILGGEDETLSPEEKARRERQRNAARGIADYRLSKDGARLLVSLAGSLFVIERRSGSVKRFDSEAGSPLAPQLSPDGQKIAVVRGGALYVIEVATGAERRVSPERSEEVTYATAEFVAAEEMSRYEGFWWAPDSQAIAYQRTDNTGVERLWLHDAMEPAKAPHPAVFPRAGTKDAVVSLHVVRLEDGASHEVKWDRATFPYLARVRWSKGAPLTLLVQDRAQQTAKVLLAEDAGATKVVHTETDEAWLNLGVFPIWRRDASAFLWGTERGGSWAIEERDPSGKLLRTRAAGLGYRGLVHLAKDTTLTLVGNGEDTRERHLYRVDPQGEVTQLSKSPGFHGAVLARDGEIWVHTEADEAGGRHYRVMRGAEEIGRLQDKSEAPPFKARAEFVEVGEQGFKASILRPRGFVAGRRYPVILKTYAGPGTTVVARPGRYAIFDQWIADHGFIVVKVDGRGTPGRGRAWERLTRGDLIDLQLGDQVSGLQALGARFPELDLSRVGIFGWSFGGYMSAMAVMRHPEVFAAGVAGAPVCDWRDYDTHYTERFLGRPQDNPKGYDNSSCLTWAKDLERPLLIVHGTVDDNVYFTHALKMSNALFRAGKPHDFLPLSGFTHMVPDPDVTRRLYGRIMGHFQTHLGLPRD